MKYYSGLGVYFSGLDVLFGIFLNGARVNFIIILWKCYFVGLSVQILGCSEDSKH